MPRLQLASTAAEQLTTRSQPDSPRMIVVVRCLVGHTVEEVERELILGSLAHYCGNRTCAAKILGFNPNYT
jgi:DNA-binding NtrC family response regulator